MSREVVSTNKPVGVYEPNTSSREAPDSWTTKAGARRLVANGDADRINRGKAIRLRTSSKGKGFERLYENRGQSCKRRAGEGW